MKIIGLILLIVSGLIFNSCNSGDVASENDNTKYVNTFIGTGGHGHTFPGATTPYGMVQLSPDTRTFGWDACGGYHYTDSSILGFSHTHLSGTGISDLGDVLFMPFVGEAKLNPGEPENPDAGYRSRFSHDEESAEPGYYMVRLADYDITAELTTTTRTGFHRYTYPENELTGVIIDLAHTIYPDHKPSHEIQVLSDTEITGLKRSAGWAKEQYQYFYAKFNKPFKYTLYEQGEKLEGDNASNCTQLKAVLTFDIEEGEQLLAKVGISAVDYEGAKNNLTAENPDWNFKRVKQDAHDVWQKQLGVINVEGGSLDQKTVFYTSLYHSTISPYVFSDVDGRYRGMDQKIHQAEGEKVYTVFSLWDTFRALHPLLTIVDPEKDNEFVNTLLHKYDEGGMLPKWELVGNYTGTMIGDHSIPVIVDAYFKGIRDYDVEKAYQAMVEAVSYNTEGILFPNERIQNKLMPIGKKLNDEMGYIPCDMDGRAVSKALEFAYNDWCIAQMAKDLGKTEDYERFMERSKRYAEYYDQESGFMRGKMQDGSWREPFNPKYANHKSSDYTEGNAFQWSFFVPHDMEGMIELAGGKESYAADLDTLFNTSSEIFGEHASGDITGLVGQYAHGNEPSHHITYMYNYVDQPWKTQELNDHIMRELYFNDPNGLAGNEDCGQMSAWYVLSAMGFYSFCPGEPVYSIGSPVFDKVEINQSNGKVFTIVANNNSVENKYIQSVSIDGEFLNKAFINHEDILKGSTIEFEMGPAANRELFN